MPVLMLILASALWGLSFPLMKALHLEQAGRMPGTSTVFLASWLQFARFGLGALVLAPLLIGRSRPTAGEIRQGATLAFWGGAAMCLQADALAYMDASASAFLTQAYCVILPLLACLRFRRKPKARLVVATMLVIAGSVFFSGIRPGRFGLGRGEIETLVAAFLFTFQILALENPRYSANRGLPVTVMMFLGISILFIPVTAISAPSLAACVAAGASGESLVLVGALSLLCSVGAYLLMNIWQPHVAATEAGLIYTMEPVFAAIYAMFLPVALGGFIGVAYPNEALSGSLLLGGSLILSANVLMQWKRSPHSPPLGSVG